MKLVLSTSNIMTGTPSVIRRQTFEKSNTELTSSLRSNFTAHQSNTTSPPPLANGLTPQRTPQPTTTTSKPPLRTWTTQTPDSSTLYIPTHTPSPLTEPRDSYDITVKLFYLPNIPANRRCIQTREAIDLVLKELGTTSIDLLIVSFPGISFDADDEDSDIEETPTPDDTTATTTTQAVYDSAGGSSSGLDEVEGRPEDIDTMITTWRTLETLHAEKIVSRLGISEFGVTRLERFLSQTKVRPEVDQINVRDCCVVPKPLILYAKKQGIQLLTHNDCTNVLPRGTLREILGEGGSGAGVLAGTTDGGEGLKGDVEPQWVVKYTAVVKDRGVVESKGYFAVAELRE